MSWTAERLDALPNGTVIAFTVNSHPVLVIKRGDGETYSDVDEGGHFYTIGVLRCPDPGSIRVVSVPIDALLSHAALSAMLAAWTAARDRKSRSGFSPTREAMRAAIAHITGEAS